MTTRELFEQIRALRISMRASSSLRFKLDVLSARCDPQGHRVLVVRRGDRNAAGSWQAKSQVLDPLQGGRNRASRNELWSRLLACIKLNGPIMKIRESHTTFAWNTMLAQHSNVNDAFRDPGARLPANLGASLGHELLETCDAPR